MYNKAYIYTHTHTHTHIYVKVKERVSHSVMSNSLWHHGLFSHETFVSRPQVRRTLPGSSVDEILQAGILEWIAIPFSRGSFQSKNQTQVCHTAGGFLTSWATREAHVYIWNLDFFPVSVITKYWVEFPVLYSRSLLFIYFRYSSVHMSFPNS